jgi:hypothetical protein
VAKGSEREKATNRSNIILDAINKKLGSRTLVCPISGDHSSWEIGEYSTAVPAIETPGENPVSSSRSYPLAVVICQECGYSFFVNLIILGVADDIGIPVATDE